MNTPVPAPAPAGHPVETMDTADLVRAMREALSTYTYLGTRAATRLLIDFDDHRWLRDLTFRAEVIVPSWGKGATGMRRALTKLRAAMRGAEPDGGLDWTHEHGSAAEWMLWLACELAAGGLERLSNHASAETDPLIRGAVAELFHLGDDHTRA